MGDETPEAGSDTSEEIVTAIDNETADLDDDGNPIVEDEDEDIDFDGLKLKVPKTEAQKVKDALLRQADYTRKTQEVADARKAVDAERASFHQSTQAEITALARVHSVDAQLAEYQKVDWQAWNDRAANAARQGNPQDQADLNAAFMEYQQLKDSRGQAAGQFNQLRQQRTLAVQQDFAKRAQETSATLSKDIPDWSPDLEAKLTAYGKQTFGFSDDEIADIKIDPRIAKVLHAAFKGSKAQPAPKAQANAAAQTITPTATVGRSSAPPAGLSDKQSTDAWMKAREKEVRSKGR